MAIIIIPDLYIMMLYQVKYLIFCYVGQCPELSPLANGDITLSSPERLSGATATYTCDSGYELDLDTGSAMRTCQADGSWEGSDRVCVRESLCNTYNLTV